MFKVTGTIIDKADIPFDLEGIYSGLTEEAAIKQFTGHAHKKFGYKVLVRNVQATKIENNNNGGNTMDLTVKQLKEQLKALGQTGLSNMNKMDLAAKLLEIQRTATQQVAVTKVPDEPTAPVAPVTPVVQAPKATNAGNKDVIDSLMRAIAHPVKLGKFSEAQGKYMHKHETQNYDAPVFLGTNEFLIAGFKSKTFEVSFICGEDGVHKVIKYNVTTNKVEISWEPSMGAYKTPNKYEQQFPVVDLAAPFGDTIVNGLIDINVITKNVIEGNATLSMNGKELAVKYTWDKNKYQAPVVYIDGVIAKDGRFKMIVMGLLDAYKEYLKANKEPAVKVTHKEDKSVENIKITDLTTSEAAITTTNSVPNKTAKRSQQLFNK